MGGGYLRIPLVGMFRIKAEDAFKPFDFGLMLLHESHVRPCT